MSAPSVHPERSEAPALRADQSGLRSVLSWVIPSERAAPRLRAYGATLGETGGGRRLKFQVSRGAATLELALSIPLLVVMLLFSIYLVDLLRARLHLQEATRYAAFELTSHVLSDYATGTHAGAFERAREVTQTDATARFRDLESVEDVPAGTLGVGYGPLEVSVTNADAVFADVPLNKEGGGGNPLAAIGGGARWMTERLGFDPSGKVTVRARMTAQNRILPARYLEGEDGFFTVSPTGGVDLRNVPLESRYTLVANPWNLPDGADSTAGPKRTGLRRTGGETGLRLQVSRMKFFGVGPFLGQLGNVAGLRSLIDFSLPDPDGTFVVSHNYATDPAIDRGLGDRGCGGENHTAKLGLNNLATYPGLDDDALRCFDTAPFRDTHDYDESLYKQMFDARGPHFMGCKQAMADDPSRPGNHSSDVNNQKVDCQ